MGSNASWVMVTWDPPPCGQNARLTNRHDRKHYLSTTYLAGGKNGRPAFKNLGEKMKMLNGVFTLPDTVTVTVLCTVAITCRTVHIRPSPTPLPTPIKCRIVVFICPK